VFVIVPKAACAPASTVASKVTLAVAPAAKVFIVHSKPFPVVGLASSLVSPPAILAGT